MTILSSRRQNTANNFYNTSKHARPTHTVYGGGTRPRWITSIPGHPGFTRSHQHPHHSQSTENLHIQISIYIGIVTTSSLAKYSVFNTLAHRAKVVSTNQQTLHKELEHIRKALQACHFPPWTLNKLQQKCDCKQNINNGPSSRVN